MNQTIREVMDFIQENDVKFVKLTFCDILGNLKNISVLASEIEDVFEKGISIDAEAFDGIASYDKGDIRLFPDPSTIQVLPWRPQHGSVIRLYSNLKYPDGTVAECDSRSLLQQAEKELKKLGYKCTIGSDCEFYLFELDEKGQPTNIPFDRAGYLDVAPLDKGENVRREICFTLERLGLKPTSSHHEKGPGQNEIRFNYNDALKAADDVMTFKTTVKSISASNGLYASFLPKPLKDKEGSGLKINISLLKGLEICDIDSVEVKSFLAGILNRLREIALFMNPMPNSYERFQSESSPKYVAWASQRFNQVIKIGKYKATINSADPSCNPYIVYALLLMAGLEGLKQNMVLENKIDHKLDESDGALSLPQDLHEAIELAENSEFVKSVLPDSLFKQIIAYKKKEIEDVESSGDKHKYLTERYFGRV